ncbi:MAG: hypothetical protein HN352_02555 [Bacteroidetes bacterium]|jgi:hypothetical protein|nr:hypothetical protein [Bacteroidota bacterium]MBT3750502.1 hypothetical protein [Bacteroidota bacterium]MBT4400122.1 hypothetical protein [Bacteroidota bacterium]MBT5424592.1 hypothetical protein [Bacteroidota bacterium]MBT7092215.1 hypothetical protein [Bacteroidota bacterium]
MRRQLQILLLIGMLAICGSCSKNEQPFAIFQISPERGHYSQKYTFDATDSHDPDHRAHELQFRWDFEADKIWDTEWALQKITFHYYPERGIYTVIMQCKDPAGDITETKREVDVSILNLKGILTDPRDGYNYKTVLIDSIWWMSQDLHHGKWLSMWAREEQIDNGIIERYGRTDFEDIDRYSGYYNYDEAMDYSYGEKTPGICPYGWYIPSNDEWISLVDHVGDKKDPAIFLSVLGDEGVNLGFPGRRYIGWGQNAQQPGGLYWSSSGVYIPLPPTINLFFFPKDTSYLRPITLSPQDSMYHEYHEKYAIALRCVKKNSQ